MSLCCDSCPFENNPDLNGDSRIKELEAERDKLKAQIKNLTDLVRRGNVHAYNGDGYHDKEDCVFCAALAEGSQ